MRYLKTFESYSSKDVLIIVDVQKSFSKYFTQNYVNQLKDYCNNFGRVYQIWDNHVDGKNVDKDYLYDENPDGAGNHNDLYEFPNQQELIEKRYNYDVDADFYKKILDESVYNEIKSKEDANELKKGDFFNTKEGTIIVYIDNRHRWFHCPNKLYDLFIDITEAQSDDKVNVVIVGGADSECILDVEITAEVLGICFNRNEKYIYSATNCPIK